jgi:transcriptional regulator with XRE-family HTH domain
MSFADNLQTIRKKNQLTQEELAEMLGVSRQAVSKWELGDGYPEVEKLLILAKKLNVSLDSLMGRDIAGDTSLNGSPSGEIRITSPHEGVIISASKVTRSQEFKTGKNSPKYALFATGGNDMSFWGAQNTFLAWYRTLEDVTKEVQAIQEALDAGRTSYTLQFSVKCKNHWFRITIDD